MLGLPENPNVLVVGAHPDDIAIGCGGTLLQLPKARITWWCATGNWERQQEEILAQKLFAPQATIRFGMFRDGFLQYNDAVKNAFEELKDQVEPDLIFAPWRNDAHQDHRCIAELTQQTFRNSLILNYEIPKLEVDCGRPNVFIPLSATQAYQKVDGIWSAYVTQRNRHWFAKEIFLGTLRLNGVHTRGLYAEAFHGDRLVVICA